MKEWLFDDDGIVWVVGFAIMAGLIWLVIWGANKDAKEWAAYSAAHHCRAVGKKEATVGTGVGPAIGGKGGIAVTTVVIPEQTIYTCDDGEMRIR